MIYKGLKYWYSVRKIKSYRDGCLTDGYEIYLLGDKMAYGGTRSIEFSVYDSQSEAEYALWKRAQEKGWERVK